jgi:hypothetical protein
MNRAVKLAVELDRNVPRSDVYALALGGAGQH